MRILIINEYIKRRGAEQIVAEQKNLFSSYNNDVRCLCFGMGDAVEKPEGYDVIHICKMSKLLFDFQAYCILRRYIKNYNPEIIIVHNIFSSPLTVYKALKGFKVIQIIHDYKVICPTAWCTYKNMPHTICEGHKSKKCLRLCSDKKGKVFIQLWLIRKCERLRKKYVDVCISPSERLNGYLHSYGYKSVCINNPFQAKLGEEKYTRDPGNLKLIYVGAVSHDKGILEFCNAIRENDKKWTLDIYGGIASDCTEQVEDIVMVSNGKIKFWGYINHDELVMKYKEYDYLIIPSICMDNYPTVILEAMGCGIVVIGTDRGGIPEMLAEERGFVYKYGDEKALIKQLEEIFQISNEKYEIMRKRAYNYVCKNNSFEKYYEQIKALIMDVMEE